MEPWSNRLLDLYDLQMLLNEVLLNLYIHLENVELLSNDLKKDK